MPDPGDDLGDGADADVPMLGGWPFAELLGSPDSALTRALRLVLETTERAEESYAAFGNAP